MQQNSNCSMLFYLRLSTIAPVELSIPDSKVQRRSMAFCVRALASLKQSNTHLTFHYYGATIHTAYSSQLHIAVLYW